MEEDTEYLLLEQALFKLEAARDLLATAVAEEYFNSARIYQLDQLADDLRELMDE